MIINVTSNVREVQKRLIERAAEWDGGPIVGTLHNNVEYIGALNYGAVIEYNNPKNPSREPGTYEFSTGRKSVFEATKTTVFIPGAHMVATTRQLSGKRFNQRINQFKPITRAKTVGLVNETLDYAHAVAVISTPNKTGTARRGWGKKYAQ